MAEEALRNLKQKSTVTELWDYAEKEKLDEKLGSKGVTPQNSLSAVLTMEIQRGEESDFRRTNGRPTRYYLKDVVYTETDEDDETDEDISAEERETEEKVQGMKEKDLHKLLSTFVKTNPTFQCITKTIIHQTSSKKSKNEKGRNEWLHPDIVGIYYPFKEFQTSTLDLCKVVGTTPYKIFSFELKLELKFSNLRQCCFQAVSNSSWANEGYLVTLKCSSEPEFLDEMKRLNKAFGIGIIQLNPDNISQSEIICSARYNDTLHFETIDRLVKINNDFSTFINDVLLDTADNNDRLRGDYDKIIEEGDEKAREYAIEKGLLVPTT